MTNKTNHKTVVYPLVDVLENDKEFLLVADLPGVGKDALDITVEAGQLELRAETPTLEFRRSFAVGDDVNLAAIDAKIERGELVIHLPKRAESRVRRIEVRG